MGLVIWDMALLYIIHARQTYSGLTVGYIEVRLLAIW
jgi:hypothetical protein